jgi:hypothetical protein
VQFIIVGNVVTLPTWVVQKSNEAIVRPLSQWPVIPLTT